MPSDQEVEAWVRDTALNVMLATETEEAIGILAAALRAAAAIPPSGEAVAWQHQLYYEDTGTWSEWRDGRFNKLVANPYRERPVYAAPPSPVAIDEAMVERIAQAICRKVPIDGSSAWNDGFGHKFPDEYSEREQSLIRTLARTAALAALNPQPNGGA